MFIVDPGSIRAWEPGSFQFAYIKKFPAHMVETMRGGYHGGNGEVGRWRGDGKVEGNTFYYGISNYQLRRDNIERRERIDRG